MASRFILTDTISSTGDGVTLNGIGDYLYVGGNATLGSTSFAGFSGVRATGTSQRIDVAGQIFGPTGIDYDAGFGDIYIFAGGSVSGFIAINFGGFAGTVFNGGTLSGNRGINAENGASVVNSGDISGTFMGIAITGTGVVANTGTISDPTAVFVNGLADISNYGYMFGGVTTFGFNDTLINRGIITGPDLVGAGDDLVDGIGGRFEKTVRRWQ